jgi:NADH dehydrogenase (ubiquinone) 1 alpha subcomplex subunit 9
MARGSGGRSSFSGVVATVFGATGFYGRYIVNRLGRTGSQIVAPYRGDEHDYRHLRLMGDLGQVVFPSYNLKDVESVAKAVKFSNVVVNAAGRDYETRNFKFDDVHVTGARAIAEACRAAGVKRLIHFSALGADPNSPSKFLRSKAEGEKAVKEVFPDATIIRPAATYGAEDRYFHYYASLRVFPLGMVPLMDMGLNIYKYPVSVSDIATAVVNIIGDKSSQGLTYELVG